MTITHLRYWKSRLVAPCQGLGLTRMATWSVWPRSSIKGTFSSVSLLLSGTCGIGQSSVGSLDVMRDNGGVLCIMRRPSVTVQDVVGDTLSTGIPADNTDGLASCVMTDHDVADRLDCTSVQHDSGTMSRRSSAAVDLNCSVMDAVSRNGARRTSLKETAVTNFSTATRGVHDGGCSDSAEQCQRVAWKRTKSYDMSGYDMTALWVVSAVFLPPWQCASPVSSVARCLSVPVCLKWWYCMKTRGRIKMVATYCRASDNGGRLLWWTKPSLVELSWQYLRRSTFDWRSWTVYYTELIPV